MEMEEQEFQEKVALCAYKPTNELSEEEAALLEEEAETCFESFPYWLKYVKIIEPPTLTNPGGVIDFQLWEHLREVIANLLTKRLITILKARQIGLSYVIAAYVLWFAMTRVGSTILLFSKAQDEAFDLLGKCYKIYGQLPEFLKTEQEPKGRGELGFPVMNSVIKAMPSTESAGVSYNASIIVYDEHDVHDYASKSYFHAKPAIDSQGGQLISIFTVNPFEQNTLAKSLFNEAKEGKNDFTWLFFPYWVRPGRDKEWYEYTKRNTSEEELGGLTRDLYMQKNFPASIEEALRPPETITVFDSNVLDEMMGDIRNPVKVEGGELDFKVVNIYQPFHIGEFYVAATDASHGIGKDYAVTVVLNVKTSCVVADIVSNLLSPEELALHSVRLLEHYHNPLWYPEDNEWGRVVITTAQNLPMADGTTGYKRFGYQDKKKTKIGWHTDEKTRFDLWGSLIPAINDHQVKIFNKEGLSQFYGIIRNASKEGRIEAAGGKHDDYPMAVGIAWCKKDEVRTTASKMEPIRTLDFRR